MPDPKTAAAHGPRTEAGQRLLAWDDDGPPTYRGRGTGGSEAPPGPPASRLVDGGSSPNTQAERDALIASIPPPLPSRSCRHGIKPDQCEFCDSPTWPADSHFSPDDAGDGAGDGEPWAPAPYDAIDPER